MPPRPILKHQMKMFCHYINNGETQAKAYEKAYDNHNVNSCNVLANKLMKNPLVIEYLNELERVKFASVQDEYQSVKSELWKISLDANEPSGNRIRAMDIINKMNAVYTEANTGSDQTTNINFGEMSPDELRELIVSQEKDGAS